MTPAPPRIALLLLQLALPTPVSEPLLGDLSEEFATIVGRQGVRAARRWYWREARLALLAGTRLSEPRAPGPVSRGDGPMWQLIADVRYAVRSLVNKPGFTAVATITLALGIGATTAIFSAVKPILFEPLPYPHPDRLAMVWELDRDGLKSRLGFATIADLAERNHTFAAMSAIRDWGPTLTGIGTPELLTGQRVSQAFFRMVGVAPAIGRDFRPEEDVAGAAPAVVLSNEFWRARFHGDSSIVGKQILLNDAGATVVGIMPAGFQDVFNPQAQIWSPLRYGPSLGYACRDCRHLRLAGRLRDGVQPGAALADLQGVQHGIASEHPTDYPGPGITTVPLREQITGAVRPALVAVLGAVALVLLVACANVTNLLLVRGTQRRGEFAVRAALGAGRHRLIRQVLTESVVLSCVGGAAGTLIAVLGVRLIVALSPANLPRRAAIHADGTLLLFSFALTLIVGLVAGGLPALHATRRDLGDGIKLAGRRSAGTARLTRGSLVVAEVALAVVLLTGSGLMLRSVMRLLSVPPGFRADHLMTMQVQAVSKRLSNDTLTRAFYDQALAAVRALPGVEAATMTSQLPLGANFDQYGVHSDINPEANPAQDPSAFRYAVSPGYLEAMNIPVVRGRTLQASDRTGQLRVALMTAAFARRVFPGVDAIGRRFRVGDPAENNWFTVVGLVGEVRQVSLAAPAADAFYVPESQWLFADNPMAFAVRTRGDPAAMAAAIRAAIWSVDHDEPITLEATMEELLRSTEATRRFVLVLFEGFAFVALLLAAAGIYGVISGSVGDRIREIGVRSALGASRGNILALVVREGMVLTAFGVAAGLGGAIAGSQTIASLLFGVSRLDVPTYAGVVALLATVAGVACGIPAWRAARIDPAITLRAE